MYHLARGGGIPGIISGVSFDPLAHPLPPQGKTGLGVSHLLKTLEMSWKGIFVYDIESARDENLDVKWFHLKNLWQIKTLFFQQKHKKNCCCCWGCSCCCCCWWCWWCWWWWCCCCCGCCCSQTLFWPKPGLFHLVKMVTDLILYPCLRNCFKNILSIMWDCLI